MSKGFWGVIIAVIIVFGGIIALSGNKSNSSNNKSTGQVSQHVEGPATAKVTLTEYGDYECPFCEQYYPTVKQAVSEFKDQIKFQFRNFPLTNIHRNAFAAARAAEAAGLQGKFWEMHDALYEPSNWQVWSNASDPTPYFQQYAQQLGLNVNQFKTDFASDQVNATVNADMAEGNKLGITGTPTFFINGKQTQIANSLQSFETAIKDALSTSSKSGQ